MLLSALMNVEKLKQEEGSELKVKTVSVTVIGLMLQATFDLLVKR